MDSPEADLDSSSTSGLTLGASLVAADGSSRREGLPRCLHVGEGGAPPLRLIAGRPLPRADSHLREVGASAISALRHGVLAPMALLGPAPLLGAPVFPRLVLLRTPAASRGGPRALRLDVAPPRIRHPA